MLADEDAKEELDEEEIVLTEDEDKQTKDDSLNPLASD